MPRSSRASAAPTLEFAGDLEFWLYRKRVKNINIRVKPPDGRVEVSAPARVGAEEVARFVLSKRSWIRSAQQRLLNAPQSKAEAASPEEQKEWKALVAVAVPILIAKWEPILGVRAGKLAYRNMKSRWGSCQPSTGRICINTRLALYPPECLEYVVVHELCHLRERGHGPKFHALMDEYLPDWRSLREKLR